MNSYYAVKVFSGHRRGSDNSLENNCRLCSIFHRIFRIEMSFAGIEKYAWFPLSLTLLQVGWYLVEEESILFGLIYQNRSNDYYTTITTKHENIFENDNSTFIRKTITSSPKQQTMLQWLLLFTFEIPIILANTLSLQCWLNLVARMPCQWSGITCGQTLLGWLLSIQAVMLY